MKTFKTPKGTELPLLDLRGKAYLQVAHRIQWFREDHPDWSIETEMVELHENATTAKAILKNEQGRTMATAHKREDTKGFQDHREKAETGAIGRALALIGYGTQFALDLDEGERIVDAPTPIVKLSPPIAGKEMFEPFPPKCPKCQANMLESKFPAKDGSTQFWCKRCYKPKTAEKNGVSKRSDLGNIPNF